MEPISTPEARAAAPLGAVRVVKTSDGLTGHRYQAFAAAWFGWRKDRRAPLWSRFDPVRHPAELPHMVLHKRIGDRHQYRVVGSACESYISADLAGRFVEDAIVPENRGSVLAQLNTARRSRLPVFVKKTMAWDGGRDYLHYDVLNFPFQDSSSECSYCLALMNFDFEAPAFLESFA